MKFPGEAAERVARALLVAGPSTAVDLADRLGMTAAGVRRILSGLMEAGLVVAHDRAPYGPSPKRGRGRPSSVFSLTSKGRAACDEAYGDLALETLRFMDRQFGDQAIEAFARDRASRLGSEVAIPEGGASPAQVAEALTLAGYAATVEPLGDVAVQLCQHHCPVVDAAHEFPAICEAETAELGRLLGRHVTRLATLAHGDEVCTTVIPIEPSPTVAVRDTHGRFTA